MTPLMSMMPYGMPGMPGMPGMGGQGSRLPFQQINPSIGMQPGSSDSLLQQRINERNNMDIACGGQPMMSGGGMPGYGGAPMPMPAMSMPPQPLPPGSANIHPAIIAKFMSMPPDAQQRYAQANPMYYQQIMATIAKQQQQYQQTHPTSTAPESETSSTCSIETPKSDTDNAHSSDDENPADEAQPKRKRRREPPKESKESKQSKQLKESKQSTATKPRRNPRLPKAQQNVPQQRELRVGHRVSNNQNVRQDSNHIYLSLDFRNDLIETNDDCYILGFPVQHNITCLELVSCLINCNPVLEREPYIYISLDNIKGDYQVTTGHRTNHVFGKLIQEKSVNEFIVYKPENCIKVFTRGSGSSSTPSSARLDARNLDRLPIRFHRFDLSTIPLNKLSVDKLRRAKDYLKVTTKSAHYLGVGDRVNISCSQDDRISVDTVDVIKVLAPDIVALENPINSIGQGSGLQFEKVDVKCTLTFKLSSWEPSR